ncbi:MAG: acyltransferase family protein [Paludibacteraceae bacterium]
MRRIDWIDIAKGIGIFLVVYGHAASGEIIRYIYGFHMPLFFFLSGLCCSINKYTFREFVHSRFYSLVVPYFFFYLLTYFLWLPMSGRDAVVNDITWWKPLVWMIYGAPESTFNVFLKSHNQVMWFLPCLFCTQVLFYGVKTLQKPWMQWIVVFVLLMLGMYIPINLPWGINNAFVALSYFYIGNMLFKHLNKWNPSSWLLLLYALGFWTLYAIVMLSSQYRMVMYFHDYQPIGILIVPLLGIAAVCATAKWGGRKLSGVFGGFCPTSWCGKNSLVIFTTHYIILRIWRFVLPKIWHTEDITLSQPWHALGLSIIVVVTLIPVCWGYNKYIRQRLLSYVAKK